MFGPLFSSVKKPKGPDLNRLELIRFGLSGNTLNLEVPYENWSQIPSSREAILANTNLYDEEQFKQHSSEDWYSRRNIFSRYFSYSSFNHPALGCFELTVSILKLHDKSNNLFDFSVFKSAVERQNRYACEKFNKNIDDEFLLTIPSEFYQEVKSNNEVFLTYENSNQLKPFPVYTMPVSSNHYVEFSFHYMSVREGDEPWYLMAKKLEKQIMESVKLKLTESFQQEKASVNS